MATFSLKVQSQSMSSNAKTTARIYKSTPLFPFCKNDPASKYSGAVSQIAFSATEKLSILDYYLFALGPLFLLSSLFLLCKPNGMFISRDVCKTCFIFKRFLIRSVGIERGIHSEMEIQSRE